MPKGFIVYPTYKIENNKAYVYLFGRLESGESFLTINYLRPYFYIREDDLEKSKKLAKFDSEKTDFTNFSKEKVAKIILDIPKIVPEIKKLFADSGIVCYEADIRFAYRFLIDKDLKGCLNIVGKYEKGEFVDRIYTEPEITPTEYFPELSIVSFDIETNIKAKKIFSIAIYSKEFKKVLIVKDGQFKNAESFKTEKEMLERFKEIILEQDYDILTGWNLIDFDLKIIKEKFAEHKISFTLGRVPWECKLRLSDSFFKDSSADIPGRVVLDGLHLAKVSFIKLEDYKLNTAAKTILGEEKLLTGESRWQDIEKYYEKDPQHLIDYNMKDAELAYNIVLKSKMIDLTIKRSMLTRMQLDRVDASIASFDSLYLKELQKIKVVAPTAVVTEANERIKGGYVRDPIPGIYENIIVLDFKSLYPSIIRTFNIDPLDYVPQKELSKYKNQSAETLIKTENGAYFLNRDGILPRLIQELWRQRDIAKKSKDSLASNAIKILMNSLFGVLANPSCRFYSLDIGNAITHSGQKLIKMTANKIAEQDYEVIYSDTDSVFINSKIKDYKEALKKGEEIAESINKFIEKYIKEEYHRKNFMELQFEKVFKKFFLPTMRGAKEGGAKKRYAGIREKDGKDVLDFTGMESKRRDWTEVSKKFQRELMMKVFREEKVEGFIKDFVSDIRSGKYDSLLIYKKAIRKSVESYTKTTPPHIQAARKAGKTDVGIIEYYMTMKGPETVESRKSKIDYEHYIEKQIKPIADSVLVFFDNSFDDLIKGSRQRKLFDY